MNEDDLIDKTVSEMVVRKWESVKLHLFYL